MIPDEYVLLVWTGLFFLPWAALYLLFAAGGLAGIAFNVLTGRPIEATETMGERRPSQMDGAGLAVPAFVFPVGLFLFDIPIGAGIVAMTAGALVASLLWIQPGYVDRVWSHDGVWLLRIGGIPLAEILFGASFGAYWSGLYEQWRWTLGRPFACKG